MNVFADSIKGKLDAVLNETNEYSRMFVVNPEKDFIRKRKLDFKEMLNILLSMGGMSLKIELMKYFLYEIEAPTSSAFVQQRDKILPEAFEYIFKKFTSSTTTPSYYEGYRMLAVDGSKLCFAANPKDKENYFITSPNARGYNILHLNAMYDLCSRVYVDSIIQLGRKENEYRAFVDMVDRSDIKDQVIVTADRGYESYNVFEHLTQKGWNYVIRVKDITSNGIACGLVFPETEAFDVNISILLTRRDTKEIRSHSEKYKRLTSQQIFDYLPVGSKENYPTNFRVIRFPISEDTYEVIITNLSKDKFPAEKIKEIYHMRWGIETSFRCLKYALGLTSFHSKKTTYIIQEIFAKLTMYNFCEIITTHVVIQQKDRKYNYQVNFTIAIFICLCYFRCRDGGSSFNVEALIQQNILPVRKGRKSPRKIRRQSPVSFIYRVA